eukprot:14258417-Alexandrium_andersonii.AAC.1
MPCFISPFVAGRGSACRAPRRTGSTSSSPKNPGVAGLARKGQCSARRGLSSSESRMPMEGQATPKISEL